MLAKKKTKRPVSRDNAATYQAPVSPNGDPETLDPIDAQIASIVGCPPGLRPRRTESELRELVSNAMAAYAPVPLDVPLSLEAAGRRIMTATVLENSAARRAAAIKAGRFTEAEAALVAAAYDQFPVSELWFLLHELEEPPLARIVLSARKRQAAQRRDAKRAWRRLMGFADAVAGLPAGISEARVLDQVERLLVQRVASHSAQCVQCDADLADARRQGTRVVDQTRQSVARILRERLPPSSWTSERIARLILASSAMRRPPCPRFVAERGDVRRMADWLRQRVRDRRV